MYRIENGWIERNSYLRKADIVDNPGMWAFLWKDQPTS